MLRIAYDVMPLMARLAGVGYYAATLLEKLMALESGIDFGLYAVTWKGDVSSIPRGVSFRHLRLPARTVAPIWEFLGRPAGERLLGNSDVVHGTNFWIPPLERRNGIVTIHDLTFWFYPELCTRAIQRYRWIIPRMLKRVPLVITPSETVRQEVSSELKFPEDRIVVTPEGIRGAFKGATFDPGLAAKLGITKSYVLFTGTQEPRKNLDRLIRAFASLEGDDLQLVISGPPGWGSVDLPAVARHLGVDGRIVFTGYLSDSQLGSVVTGARAFAFPSIYEGFGLPPLEAMAAGVPVVAANAGSLPEVLGDAPFWCDPADVDSIAAAIESAVSNEAARDSSIELGRTQAARYDWEVTAKKTLDAYHLVARGD